MKNTDKLLIQIGILLILIILLAVTNTPDWVINTVGAAGILFLGIKLFQIYRQ